MFIALPITIDALDPRLRKIIQRFSTERTYEYNQNDVNYQFSLMLDPTTIIMIID